MKLWRYGPSLLEERQKRVALSTRSYGKCDYRESDVEIGRARERQLIAEAERTAAMRFTGPSAIGRNRSVKAESLPAVPDKDKGRTDLFEKEFPGRVLP